MQEIPGPERSPDVVEQALLVIRLATDEVLRVMSEEGLLESISKKDTLAQRTGEISSIYVATVNDVLSQAAVALGTKKQELSAQAIADLNRALSAISHTMRILSEQSSVGDDVRASIEKLQNRGVESLSGFLKKRMYERS